MLAAEHEWARPVLGPLPAVLGGAAEQLKAITTQLVRLARDDQDARRMMTVPGIDPISALAFKAAIEKPQHPVHRLPMSNRRPGLPKFGEGWQAGPRNDPRRFAFATAGVILVEDRTSAMGLQMRRFAAALLAILSLSGASSAYGQETSVEPLTVEGRAKSVEDRVRTYVRAAIVKETNRSLIRWRRPICPLVAGLPHDQSEFLLQRISRAAAEAGAPLGVADCRPNIYVVVTGDPKALLKAWRRRDSNLFGHQLPARIDRFIDTDRPVRVWHNWTFEPTDTPDKSRLFGEGPRAPPTGGRVRDPSRIVDLAVRNDWGAVVVVDSKAVGNLSVGQLGAYVAMTVLTEFDLDADVGDAPTILRLFEPGVADRPADLSAWDLSLLKALYGTSQEVRMQRQLIASRVAREIAP